MAISRDATSSIDYGAGSSWTHVCAANATLLVMGIRSETGGTPTATYNGVAMTRQFVVLSGGMNYALFYLKNPSSGSNTIAVTNSDSIGGGAISYIGVDTSVTVPNASNSASDSAGASLSVTTTIDKCWSVFFVGDRSGTNPSNGTNTTRQVSPAGGASLAIFDSNGPITPAGSFNQTATISGSDEAVMQFAFAPTPTKNRMFMVF